MLPSAWTMLRIISGVAVFASSTVTAKLLSAAFVGTVFACPLLSMASMIFLLIALKIMWMVGCPVVSSRSSSGVQMITVLPLLIIVLLLQGFSGLFKRGCRT